MYACVCKISLLQTELHKKLAVCLPGLCVLYGTPTKSSSVSLSPQAIAFFLHVMEPVVSKAYVLVYFHSLVVSDNLPDSNFLKDIYTMVDDK